VCSIVCWGEYVFAGLASFELVCCCSCTVAGLVFWAAIYGAVLVVVPEIPGFVGVDGLLAAPAVCVSLLDGFGCGGA
jgi:hypothetical protein